MKRFSQYGLGLALFQALLLVMATPAQAREVLILAFGDSLSAGYGLKPQDSFPAQLQTTLRKQGVAARVHNGGVSGDTTSAGRGRLGWVLTGLKAKPDLVILELGANDMLRGQSPALAKANLDAMIADLKRRKIPVLLAGMTASYNLDRRYRAEFDGIYPLLARKHGVRLYPFFMDGVAGNRALLLPDQMHPNAKGVSVLVQRILPSVKASLKRYRR
ncbi:MAG: arylesterase [Chakrabartia sp.]